MASRLVSLRPRRILVLGALLHLCSLRGSICCQLRLYFMDLLFACFQDASVSCICCLHAYSIPIHLHQGIRTFGAFYLGHVLLVILILCHYICYSSNYPAFFYIVCLFFSSRIPVAASCSRETANGQEKDCWFLGKITRGHAAYLVTGPDKPDGFFLVRESLRSQGSFVLTVFWEEQNVQHYQLVNHGDGWFSVDSGPLFQGLDELISHYQNRSDGLPNKLAATFVLGSLPPLFARKRMVTLLHKAVASNSIADVQSLLSSPPSYKQGTVDTLSMEGQTPVHEAAKNGFVGVLKLLLKQKPNLTIRDSKGETALYVSC